jgi:hypothetical protein
LVLGLNETLSSLKPDTVMTQRAAWRNLHSLQNPEDREEISPLICRRDHCHKMQISPKDTNIEISS